MHGLSFLILLSCSGASSTAQDTDPDSMSTTQDTAETTDKTERGCVSGRLRDSNNASGVALQVDAFSSALCEPLGSTTTGSDGSFCLPGLPVGDEIVLQATFAERCPWGHAKSVTVPLQGTCERDDCAELETWYECQGDSAVCP